MSEKKQRVFIRTAVLLMLLMIAPVFIKNEYHIHILMMIFYNIIIASSLRLIMTLGLVSFSHATFVAIGGYASALSVMRLGMSSWTGLIFAIIISIIVAFIFGFILLRLKGTYFLIATFAFGEIVLLIFTRWTNPFGGAAGLINIPPPNPVVMPGLFSIIFKSKVSFYYLALALMCILLLIAYRLDRGRLGAIWAGIKQAGQLAQSVGINTMIYKNVAFTIGCSMAAVAGTFQAHYYSHVNPGGFGIFTLVNYLIFVIVGGTNRFMGPILGAAIMTIFSEILSLYEHLAIYQTIVYGIALILVVIFLPGGIVTLFDKVPSNKSKMK